MLKIQLRDDRVLMESPEHARPFANDEKHKFKSWVKRYADALKEKNIDKAGALFYSIGREMREWLDGEDHWFARATAMSDAIEIEINVPDGATKDERLFLDAPWELLAGEFGYLAMDKIRPFVIWRRIGDAKETWAPAYSDMQCVFMAAAPRGYEKLDYEKGEVAILNATRGLPFRIAVEESGCLEYLQDRIASEFPQGIEAVHLFCHGDFIDSTAVLLMENEYGLPNLYTAEKLCATLGRPAPPLVVFSACRTSENHAAGASMAMNLARNGVSNVLGWAGAVYEKDAIIFNHEFYSLLAQYFSVPRAVAKARQALLDANAEDPDTGRHWHLSRLYMGPHGGGKVCDEGKVKRELPSNTAGFQEFLDKKRGRVKVTSAETFVGRRRQTQRILHAFKRDNVSVATILGMGAQGKSSLAARIANRMKTHETVVVFEHYGALDIFDEVAKVFPFEDGENWRANVANDPGYIYDVLTHVINSKPILLVIDDFERILEEPRPGEMLTPLKPQHMRTMRCVVSAFVDSQSKSRLLITSRYDFVLPGDNGDDLAAKFHKEPLPPMNEPERKKQIYAEERAWEKENGKKSGGAIPDKEMKDLLFECAEASSGNPGLQSILSISAFSGNAGETVAALDAVKRYRETREIPKETEAKRFFERVVIETYKNALTGEEINQFRATTLFDFTVPEKILTIAGEAAGIAKPCDALHRLKGLGLVETFTASTADEAPEYMSNILARPLFEGLTDDETRHVATAVTKPLYEARQNANGDLPGQRGVEVFEVALLSRCEPEILGAAATYGGADFLHQLEDATTTLAIVEKSMAAFDGQKISYPPFLLGIGIEAALRLGERAKVDAFMQYAKQITTDDEEALAYLSSEIASVLFVRGEFDEALKLRREIELPIYERLNNARSYALAKGQVADILFARGEFDEALRIRTEDEIPIYEEANDATSRARTMGKIADILYTRGEYDEALRIRREELQEYERLGDIRSRALAIVAIAEILFDRGEYDEALNMNREALRVYERLGDVREYAATMGQVADILHAHGELDEALRIRKEEQLPVFERLGDVHLCAVVMGQISDILFDLGEYDEALRILREEELPVYERLGDIHSKATVMGQIGQILHMLGEYDEALKICEEQLPILESLKDIDGIANAKFNRAQIKINMEDTDADSIDSILGDLKESFAICQKLQKTHYIAVIGYRFGHFLAATKQPDEALQVLELSAAAYRKLKRHQEAERVLALIREIEEGVVPDMLLEDVALE